MSEANKSKAPEMVSPSTLRAEAQRLISEGKMPDLNRLLQTVSFVRSKYVPHIMNARKNESLVNAAKEKNKTEKSGKSGAPVDFPGPVFPNPKGLKPTLDTDNPSGNTGMGHVSKLPLAAGPQGVPTLEPLTNAPLDTGITPNPLVPREQ